MTWLDSLDVPVDEALKLYPHAVNVASVTVGKQTYLVAQSSLLGMQRMQLGHLPVSSITLPYELGDLLTRPHEENLIRDFSHHLSDFFPTMFVAAIYELQSLFAINDINAYIIGGITRDMLFSSERRYDIQDVDITVEGNGLEAARHVNATSKNFHLQQEFVPFGTAKLDYKGQIAMDFASTRREIYTSCGALPEVVAIGVPLEVDIIRRDFTVNALALSIRNPGQVIDCTGGLQDLEKRWLRLLKAESFFEDPSRILRALKFAARMDFTWADDTHLLLDRFLEWMPDVYRGGGERIREELYRLFTLPESTPKLYWLNLFLEKGLHRLIDTQLPPALELPLPLKVIAQRLVMLEQRLGSAWTPQTTWEVYISLLFLGMPRQTVESALHRLDLTRHEIDVVEKSYHLLNENVIYPLTPHDDPVQLYEVFHRLPMAAACVGVILSPQFETGLEAYVKYKHQLAPVKLEVTGDDVLKLGVPQGEQVGQLLKSLLYAKLHGKVRHRVDEINWLKGKIANPMEESSR